MDPADCKLLDSELKGMDILWKEGGVLAKYIAQVLAKELGWNKNTTYTLITFTGGNAAGPGNSPTGGDWPALAFDPARNNSCINKKQENISADPRRGLTPVDRLCAQIPGPKHGKADPHRKLY